MVRAGRTTIQGKYGDILKIVAVDANGNILGVLQGQYAGSPTTLLTDVDGRIQASLYGVYSGTPIQVAVNVGGQLVMADLSQANILKDESELQAWDSPIANLLSNMNRIRKQIIDITGEAWGTVSHSIAAVWAKFHASTGHKHTGAADDAPKITSTNLSDTAALEYKANKAAANGYCDLDASVLVPAARMPTSATLITSGSYTGDAGNNKAIAHGLGRTPKFVAIKCRAGTLRHFQLIQSAYIESITVTVTAMQVTGWDSTNFYVGNTGDIQASANTNTWVYQWVAWG